MKLSKQGFDSFRYLVNTILRCPHTHTLFLHAYTQREAEVGVIERLVLVNFMCHKKLDIILSPNANFIVGRSGSESPHAS